MGFLEQLRQSADELAHWAAEAGKVGVARLEELTARRRADSLLRDLGALTYAAHTGAAAPARDEVARLVTAIEEAEARADAAARHAEEVARNAQDPRP